MFLKVVTLSGKLLKIVMPGKNGPLKKYERLAVGLLRLRLFLVLIYCVQINLFEKYLYYLQ